jgi:hypothetical protein
MCVTNPFESWTTREKLTICDRCIDKTKINETILQTYFVTEEEQDIVRKFIERNYDEIVRRRCDFLTLSEKNKEKLILHHELYAVDNNSTIEYMFWEEEHAEIQAYIRDNFRTTGDKRTLRDRIGEPIITSAREIAFLDATVFAYKLKETDVLWRYKGVYYTFCPFPGHQSFGDVAGIRDNYIRLSKIV